MEDAAQWNPTWLATCLVKSKPCTSQCGENNLWILMPQLQDVLLIGADTESSPNINQQLNEIVVNSFTGKTPTVTIRNRDRIVEGIEIELGTIRIELHESQEGWEVQRQEAGELRCSLGEDAKECEALRRSKEELWASVKKAERAHQIRMAKQNNILSAETQILVRFTSRESNVNAKKQLPVGIKCEPVDQECILGSPAYTLLVRFSNGGHLMEPGSERKLPSRKIQRHSPTKALRNAQVSYLLHMDNSITLSIMVKIQRPNMSTVLSKMPCTNWEVQKAEEKEVPEDSVEECAITCSNSYGPSESNQPHKNSKVTFEEDQVDSTLLIDCESSS
ncbi:hypothetical protein H8959_019054 [Pygathrix nigripes]